MTETKRPDCLGFIMDGNRRWAKAKGLETLEGHRQGQEIFQDCVRWVRDEKIPHAVFYAFSTENWNRRKEEVDYLMELFEGLLSKMDEDLAEEKVRVRFVGQRENFSKSLQDKMTELEEKSQQYSGTTIWIALSYGGRAEIISGVNKAIELGEPVTEESFKALLWTAELPDPDMIVRTSGEQRLSNFLSWGSAYSELYFIDKEWPALAKSDFVAILNEYEKRNRRKGT